MHDSIKISFYLIGTMWYALLIEQEFRYSKKFKFIKKIKIIYRILILITAFILLIINNTMASVFYYLICFIFALKRDSLTEIKSRPVNNRLIIIAFFLFGIVFLRY